MSRRHYNLPPLTMLAAFEAAARHGSFKNAAQELNVTPGAVSHQIKALEQELGCALFLRRHRGVELTSSGTDLCAVLSNAFERIAAGLTAVRNTNATKPVTVGATSAVASLLLTPAVSRFWRENGNIPVNQIVSDHGFERDMNLDMFIRYGPDKRTNLCHISLFRDRLIPVGSPTVKQEAGRVSLSELANMRLIHLDSFDATWTSWEEWFKALGYTGPIAQGIRVNNYTIALQAARDGAGIALGWEHLIEPVTRTRELVSIGSRSLTSPESFFVVSRDDAELSSSAKQLRDWIVGNLALE